MTIDDISYIDTETINGLNLYAYCGNNPVMRVDENGTAWWHNLVKIIAVVALVAVVVASVVVTGGASLAAVGVGFAIGATANVVVQGVTNVINGDNFFQNINIETVLISGLAGAAFATGLGGFTGAFGIGFTANVAMSAVEEKSIGAMVVDGIIGGLFAGAAFKLGQLIGQVVYKADDFVFTNFLDIARVDGANVIRGSLTALASSWFKFIPNITPGVTRAALSFFWKKIGARFNGK